VARLEKQYETSENGYPPHEQNTNQPRSKKGKEKEAANQKKKHLARDDLAVAMAKGGLY